MSKKNKEEEKDDNYLDRIPCYNKEYLFKTDENGKITILIENRGFFNSIAQILLKKPRVSQVHLDEMGNFIWPLVDGKRSIYDIAQLVKEHFGEDAEPLYSRLVVYMRNLENNQFLIMK